jgi:hypothetical protein
MEHYEKNYLVQFNISKKRLNQLKIALKDDDFSAKDFDWQKWKEGIGASKDDYFSAKEFDWQKWKDGLSGLNVKDNSYPKEFDWIKWKDGLGVFFFNLTSELSSSLMRHYFPIRKDLEKHLEPLFNHPGSFLTSKKALFTNIIGN